jgi:hypothetical protein
VYRSEILIKKVGEKLLIGILGTVAKEVTGKRDQSELHKLLSLLYLMEVETSGTWQQT